jgi:hypothetical protein
MTQQERDARYKALDAAIEVAGVNQNPEAVKAAAEMFLGFLTGGEIGGEGEPDRG